MAKQVEIRSEGDKLLQVGDWLLGSTIGKGSFGKVKLASHYKTQEKVAIKIVDKKQIANVEDVERVYRETFILTTLKHVNIIKLYEVLDTPSAIMLVMEYAGGGELYNFVLSKLRLDEIEACRFFHQIVNGVEYCHRAKVIHRDLKLENILLDKNGIVKIADFGLSNSIKFGQKMDTNCGTPSYTCPEQIMGKKYIGSAADIWAMGVILFAMVSGFLPFEADSIPLLFRRIKSRSYRSPEFLSKECIDLIDKMLTIDPEKRITLAEIRVHPWFNMEYTELADTIEQFKVVTSVMISEAREKCLNAGNEDSSIQSNPGHEPQNANSVHNNNHNKKSVTNIHSHNASSNSLDTTITNNSNNHTLNNTSAPTKGLRERTQSAASPAASPSHSNHNPSNNYSNNTSINSSSTTPSPNIKPVPSRSNSIFDKLSIRTSPHSGNSNGSNQTTGNNQPKLSPGLHTRKNSSAAVDISIGTNIPASPGRRPSVVTANSNNLITAPGPMFSPRYPPNMTEIDNQPRSQSPNSLTIAEKQNLTQRLSINNPSNNNNNNLLNSNGVRFPPISSPSIQNAIPNEPLSAPATSNPHAHKNNNATNSNYMNSNNTNNNANVNKNGLRNNNPLNGQNVANGPGSGSLSLSGGVGGRDRDRHNNTLSPNTVASNAHNHNTPGYMKSTDSQMSHVHATQRATNLHEDGDDGLGNTNNNNNNNNNNLNNKLKINSGSGVSNAPAKTPRRPSEVPSYMMDTTAAANRKNMRPTEL